MKIQDDTIGQQHRDGLSEFERQEKRFSALLDSDPAIAVCEARKLSSTVPVGGVLYIGLKAAVLVDGGSLCRDTSAIAEGVSLFRQLSNSAQEDAHHHYNLGNGLVAHANAEPYIDAGWYLATSDTRREARHHFQKAVAFDKSNEVSSVSVTNLGNALWKAHRWAEAYDSYSKALEHDPSNAIAATGAIRILIHCLRHHIGDRDVLLSVAAKHMESAKIHADRIVELAGAQALQELSTFLTKSFAGGRAPNLDSASAYEKFVASNRLALSPTIEGLDPSLKRWDSLRIESITESIDANFGVPPLFAMFNVLKSDFLVARKLAYHALCDDLTDSGDYADTLDYAIYGVTPSMLSLAQRACIDVLDKIAVAATECFGISQKNVYFGTRWFATKGQEIQRPLAWHQAFQAEIQRGNTALIALAELSLDLSASGALFAKKTYRNASTHRFTVLHDLGCKPSRQSEYVEHCSVENFKTHLLESLQIARSALLYFAEMVSIKEENKEHTGIVMPMNVPSHHYIRGSSDE